MNIVKENRKWHWIFWGFYFLVIHVTYSNEIFEIRDIMISMAYTVCNAGAAYVVLDWWIPRFDEKRQYGRLIVSIFGTIFVFSVLLGALLLITLTIRMGIERGWTILINELLGSVFSSNFSGITAFFVPYFVGQRIGLERQNRLLKRENRKWHWVFWGVYFLVNHIIFSNEIFELGNLITSIIFTAFNIVTAYVVLDWWFPKFYKKRQYGRFILSIFGTVFVIGTLLGLTLLLYFTINFGSEKGWNIFINELIGPVFLSNLSGVTALFIPYFVGQRIDMERRNSQLEKEKLESELKFLKSQLHPHFLFNALNNIYFLIKKDPDTAAEALAGFSNLLRFQLYDANNSHVPLEKEIEYLQQFADIAQLRKGENFKVNWDLASDTQNVQIAPLLLMPLIENAFKHSSNKNGKIDIDLKVDDQQQLQFRIANSKEKNKSQGIDGFEEGGIGLSNIQKRLKLIYPNRHKFLITDTAAEYIVDLKVALEVLTAEQSEAIKTITKLNHQTTI